MVEHFAHKHKARGSNPSQYTGERKLVCRSNLQFEREKDRKREREKERKREREKERKREREKERKREREKERKREREKERKTNQRLIELPN